MKMKKVFLIYLVLTLISCVIKTSQAQSNSTNKDSLSYRKRGVIDSLNDKLAKKPYVYVSPYYFRVYNSDKEYIAFQLGKRKRNKLFLYIKVFSHNVCIRNGKVIEFIFEDGSVQSFQKNKYPINCEGVIVIRLKRKQRKILTSGKIKSFMVFTFQKDYTFHITEEDAQSIQSDIHLLKNYKF